MGSAIVKRRLLLLALWVLCLWASVMASLWMLFAALLDSPRAWTLAVGYDQLANAAFGGSEDETISSRAYKASLKGQRWGCVLCRFLDWLTKDHCKNSVERDEGEKIA